MVPTNALVPLLSRHQSKIQHYNHVCLGILLISDTNPRDPLAFLDYMDISPNFRYELYIHTSHYSCKKASRFHFYIYHIITFFILIHFVWT